MKALVYTNPNEVDLHDGAAAAAKILLCPR